MLKRHFILILFGLGICSMGWSEENPLPEEAISHLSNFLEIVLKTDDQKKEENSATEIQYTLKRIQFENPVDLEFPVFDLNNEAWKATIRGDTGECYSFSRRGMFREERSAAAGLTHKDAISEEEAFSAFLPIARFYSLPLDKKQYRVKFMDMFEEDPRANPRTVADKDLYGSRYSIRYYISYRGIPCRERWLSVNVSAISKRISIFSHYPLIIPEPEKKLLAKAEAHEIATKWLSENSYVNKRSNTEKVIENDLDNIQRVIASPNTYLTEESMSRNERRVMEEAYYCWAVPITLNVDHGDHMVTTNGEIWVSINSGKVIGGQNVRK